MKMNKAVAAVAAGIIAFGGMFSVSAAGIGYVNLNYVMSAHPKMQKAQLDMKAANQKAGESFKSRTAGKTDQEKQQIGRSRRWRRRRHFRSSPEAFQIRND